MNFKFLFDYFRKCIKLCNEVSDISNNNRLYTYYDFLKSALLHGCLIRQYRYGGFYKMKGCERRAVITYPRMLKIYLKSASNLNGNLNCSKELEHYAS